MFVFLNLFCIIVLLMNPVSTFLGYDCDIGIEHHARFSIETIEECKMHTQDKQAVWDKTLVQVVQQQTTTKLKATLCFMESSIMAFTCKSGYYASFASSSVDLVSQPVELTEGQCKDLAKKGFTTYIDTKIFVDSNGLGKNYRKVAGEITRDSNCRGVDYTVGGILFEDQVVREHLKLVVTSITLDTNGEDVFYKDIHCSLDDGSCYDVFLGTIVWHPSDFKCMDLLGLIYQGPGHLNYDSNQLMINDSMEVHLEFSNQVKLCSIPVLKTEVGGIFIAEKHLGSWMFPLLKQPKVDPLLYIQTSILSSQQGLRQRMLGLFETTSLSICSVHKQVLTNKILSMPQNTIVKWENRMLGRKMGDVVYIFSCPVVSVQPISFGNCTLELPVSHKNKTRFLDPTNGLIVDAYTLLPCDTVSPPMYFNDGIWISRTKSNQLANPPDILPVIRPVPTKWLKSKLGDGIYTREELEQHRRSLSYAGNREKRLNTWAIRSESGGGEISSAFVTSDYDRLKLGIQSLWDGFRDFGSIMAGVFTVISIVLFGISVVFNGRILYQIHGLSFQLLKSLCAGATNFETFRKSVALKENQELSEQEGSENGPTTSSLYPTFT